MFHFKEFLINLWLHSGPMVDSHTLSLAHLWVVEWLVINHNKIEEIFQLKKELNPCKLTSIYPHPSTQPPLTPWKQIKYDYMRWNWIELNGIRKEFHFYFACLLLLYNIFILTSYSLFLSLFFHCSVNFLWLYFLWIIKKSEKEWRTYERKFVVIKEAIVTERRI